MPTNHKSRYSRILYTADAQLSVVPPTDGSKSPVLVGYAVVWNKLSNDRGGFKVRLKPYSAKFATPSFALFHHDKRMILGNTANETLRLIPDDIGVKIYNVMPNTSAGNDTAELVGNKYVTGMSFGMLLDPVPKFEAIIENGERILEFSDFMLDEVTVTADPAFIDATVELQEDNSLPVLDDSALQLSRLNACRLDRVKLDRLKLAMLAL